MEVDWGGKLIANSMVYWGAHEPNPPPPPQIDTTSLKLTGEAMIPVPIIWMSSCPLKLTGE